MSDTHPLVRDVPSRVQLLGDGAQTAFPFWFSTISASDVEVYLGDTLMTAGFATTRDASGESGTVIFTVPPAAGVVVTLRRARPYERLTDFQEAGAFRAQVVNDELDSLEMQIQQLRDQLARAVLLSLTAAATPDLTLPAPIGRRALIFNQLATALTLTDHDPDEAWTLITQASGLVEAAEAQAALAAARAAAAVAAVANTGAGSRQHWGPITLQVGVQAYLLPRQPSGPQSVDLVYDDVVQTWVAADPLWIIDDTIQPGRTLVLQKPVTSDGAGGTFKAGNTIRGTLVGALVGDTLGAGSIGSRELEDGAIDRPALFANGVVGLAAISPSADLSARVVSLPVAKIDTSAVSEGALLQAGADGVATALPISATDGDVPTVIGGALAYQPRRWSLGQKSLLQAPAVGAVSWSLPTEIVSSVSQVDIEFWNMGISGSDMIQLQLGVGSPVAWITAGYTSAITGVHDSGGDGNDYLAWASTSAFVIGFPGTSAAYNYTSASFRLQRVNGNTWKLGMVAHYAAGVPRIRTATGLVTLAAPMTQFRLGVSGTNTFTAGTVSATAEI